MRLLPLGSYLRACRVRTGAGETLNGVTAETGGSPAARAKEAPHMSSVSTTRPTRPTRLDVAADRSNGGERAAGGDAVATAAHQAFWLLRIGFTVAPILFGLDKFFNWSVDWPDYLAGWINSIAPGSGQDFMYFVGGVEILAGLLVLFAPRIGAFVVAGWLAGIVINLLTNDPPLYYDIALRDFGLMLGALTLGRLALAVVPARKAGLLPRRPW